MNTPATLTERFPHLDLDPVWIAENIERGRERITKVPPRYTTAAATEPTVQAWVAELLDLAVERSHVGCVSVRSGPSLLILGPTGTGKTFQAYGAVRALAISGAQCPFKFATAADLYAELRPQSRVDTERLFQRIADARLLVIDDLGAAKGSEWTEEINYRLINHRYEHELPTLITSNIPARELGAAVGERVASRLVEMCRRVTLRGEDRRRAAAAQS
ncbi:ATP-binding protein [Crossiella sp. SN42]|uniref:ATP-binding protein n=1 Tax=Crossiella sp. SN42 TaxID=2944808 RepID=UPI00207D63BE|nr:ATP-binding protein [Crossiella sp. SN42]MCO1575006.1 ATP-binding protein [Crossiella sp. SN42]